MTKYLFISSWVFLLPLNVPASIAGRAQTEILSENSDALDLQYKSFTQSSSYDNSGNKLSQNAGDSFTLLDWNFKYSKGIKGKYEASSFLNYRIVKSESQSSSAANSGFESAGFAGKYLIHSDNLLRSMFGVHLKKALFQNTQYTTASPPPSDKVALGDDGLEYGLDYFLTYYSNLKKIDFQIGYNRPASNLSSEITYNIAAIFSANKWAFFGGGGGIFSLKNDSYTNSTSQKPLIGSGNSLLFNSTNREVMFLNAGAQYPIDNFVLGLKGETVISGRSTDKGNSIFFNIRWEPKSVIVANAAISSKDFADHKYFADGFVEKVANKGEYLKINIGLDKKLYLGAFVDIFNINDYAKGIPVATGVISKVDSTTAIVKINTKYSTNPIQMAYLVRVY